MLQAARAVQSFVGGVALEEYRQDLKLRSAVERQLELIGEAAARSNAKLRSAREEIPWKAIIGQRNILAHDYGEIDDARVFTVAVNDVPRLTRDTDRASRTSVDMRTNEFEQLASATTVLRCIRYRYSNVSRDSQPSVPTCYTIEDGGGAGMERTLSQTEAKVVLDLEWRNQETVTLADLRDTLGVGEGYARQLAHRLVTKRWFERLRPGLFQFVPAARGREGVAGTSAIGTGAVLVSPYFYSFATACTHHLLTHQVFSEVYLACQVRRAPVTIHDVRYIFVHVPGQRWFGFEEISTLGQLVQMATPERALLDAVNRPQYSGGIGEVSLIVARAAEQISWNRLRSWNRPLEYLRAWGAGSSALVQRLGFFLDLHQADLPARVRRALLALMRPNSKILLGSRRRWGTTGQLVRPWNVVANVPDRVLISKKDRPRRRVVFARRGQ